MIWEAIKYRFYERWKNLECFIVQWILGNTIKRYSRKCHGIISADNGICEQCKQCRYYIGRALYKK